VCDMWAALEEEQRRVSNTSDEKGQPNDNLVEVIDLALAEIEPAAERIMDRCWVMLHAKDEGLNKMRC